MQEVSQFYRFRPDEIFRRITVTSMVQLMLEQSKLEIQEDDQATGRSGPQSPESGGEDSAVEADMHDEDKTVVMRTDDGDEETGSVIESVVFRVSSELHGK